MLARAQEEGDAVLEHDAEDLVLEAAALFDELVQELPAGFDLRKIRDWRRKAQGYFG